MINTETILILGHEITRKTKSSGGGRSVEIYRIV
jgi:hypothetical protein